MLLDEVAATFHCPSFSGITVTVSIAADRFSHRAA
jgi:hypothetical protein